MNKNNDWMLTITVNDILGKRILCDCGFPIAEIVGMKHRRTIMDNVVRYNPVFNCKRCGLKLLREQIIFVNSVD